MDVSKLQVKEQAFKERDGRVDIQVDEYGKHHKETVVLIHGIGGSPTIWFRQLRALKKEFRVLAVHLPGHGKNTEIREEIDLDKSVEYVRSAVREKCSGTFHLVGISLGSLIADRWKGNYPDDLKSVVLGGMITKWTLFAKVLLNTAIGLRNVMGVHFLYKVMAWIMMPRKSHKASREAFVKESSKISRGSLLCWLPVVKDVGELTDGKVPTLYISGEEDHMFINDVKGHVETGKYSGTFIEGSGHVCNIDDAETFNRAMMGHLKGHVSEGDSENEKESF